jgi:Fe-S cluster assembly iron-binding protein IscA
VPTDKDSIIESEGIKFVVEKELAKSVRGIIVDYRMVASDKKLIVRPLSYSH